ncbi:MAG: hypothetical protein AAF567_24630 [Actinomycetota bacterium]
MDDSHIDERFRIGDTLIFENDRVRVWELALDPGEESHAHEHANDYVMICIEGDKVAGKATPGQDDPYGRFGDFVDIPTGPGHTLYVEGGVHETAVNTGSSRYRNILVELLDG